MLASEKMLKGSKIIKDIEDKWDNCNHEEYTYYKRLFGLVLAQYQENTVNIRLNNGKEIAGYISYLPDKNEVWLHRSRVAEAKGYNSTQKLLNLNEISYFNVIGSEHERTFNLVSGKTYKYSKTL